MKKHILNIVALFIISLVVFPLSAQSNEGRELYNDGKYQQAIALLEPVVKKNPKDGVSNYYIGASYYKLGRYAEAMAPLKAAKARGVADAMKLLAEIALEEYDVDQAEEYLDDWLAAMEKANQKPGENYNKLRSRLVIMRNMLERVELIQIFDSIQVDAGDFFRYYKLSRDAGALLSASRERMLGDVASPGVVYKNANNTELFWAMNDSEGTTSQIYTASILGDGSLDHPVDITSKFEDFNGSSNFPFLMTDGMTLYFANNGSNSLGGYDIFMTRRGDDGFLQPQNIGMPYNSPYNDYMLAIDEENGVGWWATDRNAPEGKVTIYTYMLNDVRKNAESDDENSKSLAKVTSIAATQQPSVDYSAVRKRIDDNLVAPDNALQKASFEFSLGNGKVYTSLSDFRSPQARSLMDQYMAEVAQKQKCEHLLELYRKEYASGNHNVSDQILSLERRILEYPQILQRLSNQVITAEISNR